VMLERFGLAPSPSFACRANGRGADGGLDGPVGGGLVFGGFIGVSPLSGLDKCGRGFPWAYAHGYGLLPLSGHGEWDWITDYRVQSSKLGDEKGMSTNAIRLARNGLVL
jgi:hypothetical protein